MAAVAPKETYQAAAAAAAASDNDNNARPPAKLLHPQLLMAARRGDSKRLKELLGLEKDDDDDDESGMLKVPKAAAKQDEGAVVVEVDRHRPSSAAAAAPDDSPPLPLLGLDGVTAGEGDSLLHVVAASGDSQEFLDCATMIHDQVSKGLLGARNNKGDTPLHCAAGAGNAHMISHLVALVTGDEAAAKAFLRLENDLGETALHHAVRAANMPAIDQLLSLDSELACRRSSIIPPCEGGEKQQAACSPLYLAVSLGEMDIARRLFDASSSRSKRKLSYYSGPCGRNVLHAAISRRAAVLHMLLEWIKKEQKTMAADMMLRRRQQQHVMRRSCVTTVDADLLAQLTSQREKEKGSTPLHLAASLGGLPSPVLPPWLVRVWPSAVEATRLLLDANESMAYQPDNEGLYPIHVAAGAGSLDVVVKALLERCPECATLRDDKGRTFLHVAAEEGRKDVDDYVCWQSQRRRRRLSPGPGAGLLSSILNAQDINGDTALHRAVHAGNWAVFFYLAQNQRVRLDVTNKEGMTPIDVAWREMPLKVYYAWDTRIHIRNYLLKVGAPYGKNRGDLFHQRYKLPKQDEDKMSDNLTGAAQVLGLFSVLMTTATFASAFTLPGGYRSAGDGGGVAGTPVLAGPRRSYAFDAFVLSNAMAFLCSLYATSLLLYAGVPYGTLAVRFRNINAAYCYMWQAGRCLLAAFALGLYVVLFPVARTITIAVLVLVGIVAVLFLKDSEGISSVIVIGRPRRLQSTRDFLLRLIIYALDRFWSYIIIFGLPAIHKWGKLP